MTNTDIKSRFYILHLEIALGKENFFRIYFQYNIIGSDRHDIHLHMERPPLVRDLMEEIEKKSRVTVINQQLIYRGEIS
jgi:hypothetical protein